MSDDLYGPPLPPGFKNKTNESSNADIGPSLPNPDTASIGPCLPTDSAESESYGPQISASKNNSKTTEISIGPALPPHLQNKTETVTEFENENDSYGPCLPPGLKNRDEEKGQNIGPQLPTGFAQSKQQGSESPTDSDSDDDAIGPLPYMAAKPGDFSAAEEFEQRAKHMKDKLTGKLVEETEVPKHRESWMTELPEEVGKNFGLGPRTFRKNPAPERGDRSGWTETPADKEKREREEREGKSAPKRKPEQYVVSKRDENIRGQIEEMNKNRQESLMDLHVKKRKKEKEAKTDEPQERRPFDRELDLKTNRFDDAMRKQMIKKSQQLNSRFGHGSQQFI